MSFMGIGDDPNSQYGQSGNPSNYNTGANQGGFGGPGEIAGGGMVPFGGLNLPYFNQDRQRLGDMLNNQSPFASGDWSSLITMLKQRAAGAGPSIAGGAYNQAVGDAQSNMAATANGSASPDAARQALIQEGRLGQGRAAGYAQARNEEMVGAEGALGTALNQRDSLNQQAYLNILGQQLGLSQAQLKALMGDQSYSQGMAGVQQQADAAKLSALSGMLGGFGKLGAGGGK